MEDQDTNKVFDQILVTISSLEKRSMFSPKNSNCGLRVWKLKMPMRVSGSI